jgi:pyruvate/2-oxoglutarate dehydrogenase complex dihydrolipoamide acyltransferase (E2) component
MADPKYDIYFRGDFLPGADEAKVKAAIAKIFKADDAKLAQLFSGKVNTIKKAVDKIPSTPTDAISEVASTSETTQQVKQSHWDILPTGSDLLAPAERRNIPDADIDTSAIKMVSPFAEVETDEKVDPPAPDTSHISVAAVGEDMNPTRSLPVADLELDLSEFTVAEVGAALADKKEKEVPPAPDTNHIKLV